MTDKVIHLPGRRAGGTLVHTHTTPRAFPKLACINPESLSVIENALSMALHFVRQPGALPANLWAATSRATRAATLLKQACEGVPAVGSAS